MDGDGGGGEEEEDGEASSHGGRLKRWEGLAAALLYCTEEIERHENSSVVIADGT